MFAVFLCRENFLQVDIFYQEISYEAIEQNIAFEFLSLLSEVGGFLGLLLGASVLTLCEFVDYVSLSFMNRIHVQKRVRVRDDETPATPKPEKEVKVKDPSDKVDKFRSWR